MLITLCKRAWMAPVTLFSLRVRLPVTLRHPLSLEGSSHPSSREREPPCPGLPRGAHLGVTAGFLAACRRWSWCERPVRLRSRSPQLWMHARFVSVFTCARLRPGPGRGTGTCGGQQGLLLRSGHCTAVAWLRHGRSAGTRSQKEFVFHPRTVQKPLTGCESQAIFSGHLPSRPQLVAFCVVHRKCVCHLKRRATLYT